jgi:hypothetical protein
VDPENAELSMENDPPCVISTYSAPPLPVRAVVLTKDVPDMERVLDVGRVACIEAPSPEVDVMLAKTHPLKIMVEGIELMPAEVEEREKAAYY